MSRLWSWSFYSSLVLSILAFLVGAGVAWVTYFQPQLGKKDTALSKAAHFFPDVSLLKDHFPKVTYLPAPKGKQKGVSSFTISLVPRRPAGWVSLSEVSREAIGAVIVSEDWAFYQHPGYDARMIREAIKEDLEEGSFARGASTLTQQVVKNVFLSSEKSIVRKIKELVLAVRLEKVVGKRKILETYLNIAEWGEGLFGIRQAAQFYFKKGPAELTAKEGAFLAMLLPSPKRYSQSYRRGELTPYARSTIQRIIVKMLKARYLTEEAYPLAVSTPLSFEKVNEIQKTESEPEPSIDAADPNQ
jgi:monofunctional biosynthetic peptidoglycan transglycosylase